jgi:hypothetical protein
LLIQFRVENHRSLRDEQTLSLAASSLSARAGAHLLRADGLGEAMVPVVAIYGANASGKSNVLGALGFMRNAVLDSQRSWDVKGTPQEPFRLSAKRQEPSLYEVDVVVGGTRYRYGFQLSASRVDEEWMYAWPHERKAMWFEREGDRFEFGKHLHGENDAIRNLTRPNSLFLSAAAQNNHAALGRIFFYFDACRFSLGHRSESINAYAVAQRISDQSNGADRRAILAILQLGDTGIVDIRANLPEKSEAQLSLDMSLEDRSRYHVERYRARRRAGPPLTVRHRTTHDDDDGWLPLSLESRGTVALLALGPDLIDTLRDGGLLCIDELEASLHPSLALHVVRMFNDPKQNPKGAQLVFATHDTNLLGSLVGEPGLHRDQVWFTEKDEGGGTHLYPLTDFHPRKEENLERGYLQGRYGAVPFLGELVDRLIALEPEGELPPAKTARRKSR